MKTYNLKESLIQMDRETDFKYTLTDLYEACQLTEDKKRELVKYIDAKDPVGMNAMLCNEVGVMTENVSDDIPDDEMPELEGWSPDMSECPACGDFTFNPKRGRCNACSYVESLEEAVEYVKWVQLPDGKWKMWGSNPNSELDPDFLNRAIKQNGINYKDAKVARNGEYPEGVTENDVQGKNSIIKESFAEGDMVWVKPSNKPGRVVSVKGDVVEVEIQGGKDPDRRDRFYASDLEKDVSLNESDGELDFSCYNLTDEQIEKVKYIRQHLNTPEGYKAYYELEKEITDEGGCMDIFYDLSADFAWDNRFSVAITRLALADNRPDLADPNYLPGGCYAEYMNDPKYANVLLEEVNGQHLEATLRAAAQTKLAEMDYDDDFINEYFGIKLEDTEDNRIKVTVWGELYYEELDQLADVLNYIIAEEDPDAYFDHETTGRIVAYIRKDQSEDIPDEAIVSEWSEKFNGCSTWEELKDVYGEFYNIRDDLNNGTHKALYDIIDKKINELKPVEENLQEEYKVKFFQIFEAPKTPTENGKMIGQRGTLKDANSFGKEKVGEGNYIIKAVCTDGKTRHIDNDTSEDAYQMEEALNEDAEETPAAIYSMLDASDSYVDNDDYPEGASEEEIIKIAEANPDCMKVTKWVDGMEGPDEVIWERPVDTWYVSKYEGGSAYEPAEGGYYYETLTLADSEEFPSKEAAQKRLAELASQCEDEIVGQNDNYFRIKLGKYIGDCEEYRVEAKKGAYSEGKKVYEGLNEAILKEIEAPEEKPYSATEIQRELKSLTQNFTATKDTLKCGFKEENDVAVKLLKKHYKNVTSEKSGQWFEITFSEPIKELKEGTKQKRIACTTEFDNGNVIHNDWQNISDEEAEELAKQRSIENPGKVYYVKYDDIMNPCSDYKWKNGQCINESKPINEAMIYTDVDGFLGEPGETYTMSQFRRMWQDKDNDPVMSGYGSFEEWVAETISQMDATEEQPEVAPSGRGSASCKLWVDVNGIMGDPGNEYTLTDLASYWEDNKGSDPVLVKYEGDWKKWLDDTLPQMEEHIDSSLYEDADDPKSWPDDKELTYEEALALAKAYYSQGGDGFIETADKQYFNELIKEFGPQTVKSMKQEFGVFDSVAKDRMGDDVS